MSTYNTEIPNSNASFSYTTKSDSYILRTRVREVASGFTVVATESHARIHRAMYPMQKALAPFAVQLELKGYEEFQTVMDFFRGYIYATAGSPTAVLSYAITVTAQIPGSNTDNFYQIGIPISGVSSGDHVGSMVFQPVITFESFYDPNDKSTWNSSGVYSGASVEDFGNTPNGDASKFFYPRSVGSLDPNAQGATLYDFLNPQVSNLPAPTSAPTPTTSGYGGVINGLVNGGSSPSTSSVINSLSKGNLPGTY